MHTRRPEGGRSEEGYRKERGVVWEQEKQWTKTVEQVGGVVEALSPEARGREAWIRRVRTTSFVVRITRSALPFWEEVYEQDICS